MVILVRNSVYSVVFLVLSFISAAGILFIVECELFALLFIVVYVGAIAVLFLFVVMMLDVKTVTANKDSLKYFPFGLFVALILSFQTHLMIKEIFEISYLDSISFNNRQDWFYKVDSLTEIEALGQVLYTHYVLQFLVGGLILTLAVIGAVNLTVNLSEKKSHNQVITKQLSRRQHNALYF